MMRGHKDKDQDNRGNSANVPPNIHILELMDYFGTVNVDRDMHENNDDEDQECLLQTGRVEP